MKLDELQIQILNELADGCHKASVDAGWWSDLDRICGQLKDPNDVDLVHTWFVAAKIALIHSEVSEMLEALRKGTMDDHLKHRRGTEVESGDAHIRLLDLDGFLRHEVGEAISEKMEYNRNRADHKPENRNKPGGKSV